MPREFVVYLEYVKSIKFDEKPDYTYLKKIFKKKFVKEGYEFDWVYDWILVPLDTKNLIFEAKMPITIDLIENEE